MLGAERDRIGLERQEAPGRIAHFVFVPLPLRQLGNEQFPDAGLVPQAHRMAPAVPDVEVADDADIVGVRCPDDKAAARDVAVLDHVRAEDIVEARRADVLDGGEIVGGKHRSEGIGVPFDARFARPGDFELVVGPVHRGNAAAEEAGRVDALQLAEEVAALDGQRADLGRSRQHGTNLVEVVADPVRSEDGEGIAMGRRDDRCDRAGMDGERRLLGAPRRSLRLGRDLDLGGRLGWFVHVRDTSPIMSRTPRTGMSIQSGRWLAS